MYFFGSSTQSKTCSLTNLYTALCVEKKTCARARLWQKKPPHLEENISTVVTGGCPGYSSRPPHTSTPSASATPPRFFLRFLVPSGPRPHRRTEAPLASSLHGRRGLFSLCFAREPLALRLLCPRQTVIVPPAALGFSSTHRAFHDMFQRDGRPRECT